MNISKKIFSTRLAMFILMVIAFLVFAFFQNVTEYRYDADYYWLIADPVFENRFNILKFPETYRGYLFPVLIGVMKYAVNRLGIHICWGWRILISVMISGMLVYAFPIIFKKNTSRVNWFDYLTNGIYVLIFIIFWGEFIQYPLSDFPACFFMIMGIAALIWIKDRPNKVYKIIGGIIAGASLYATYNTRVAYLYSVLIVVIAFSINLFTKKSYKNLPVLGALIIGMLVMAAPQMMINYQYVRSYSPKVYTEQLTGYQISLETQQLFWGLGNPRYETYIGNMMDYPSASVRFDDPIGNKIIEIEGITAEDFSYGTIFLLFIKYPLDIGGIYIRHLLSLMTPIFKQAYITDMYTGKGIFISLAILIWMIAAIDILFVEKKNFDSMLLCMFIAMVLPSLLQLAGAPELRFFLMIYLLLYYYVVNIINYRKLWQNVKKRWMPMVLVCTIIYFMWISSIGMLLSYNSERVLIINDKHYECISETEVTD